MTVLESDLRALSAEARRRYPAIKDAAEHAILKVLSHSFISPLNLLHADAVFLLDLSGDHGLLPRSFELIVVLAAELTIGLFDLLIHYCLFGISA